MLYPCYYRIYLSALMLLYKIIYDYYNLYYDILEVASGVVYVSQTSYLLSFSFFFFFFSIIIIIIITL